MNHLPPPDRLECAYQTALAKLLAERTPEGYWVGELSTSALSTATAVSALSLVGKATSAHGSFDALVRGGLDTRQIAEELGLSPVTVRRHLGAVAQKIGADGRGELVRALHAS